MKALSHHRRVKRRVLGTNLILLLVLFGLINLQAYMMARHGMAKDTFWESSLWFAVYFAIGFGGNLPLFEGAPARRAGRALLATVVLAVTWIALCAFCGHVLGLRYG